MCHCLEGDNDSRGGRSQSMQALMRNNKSSLPGLKNTSIISTFGFVLYYHCYTVKLCYWYFTHFRDAKTIVTKVEGQVQVITAVSQVCYISEFVIVIAFSLFHM